MSPENYYEILGVDENAGDDEIKQAFRDLAKHYHPDRNPGDQEAERNFKRVNTAYEGLKDASRRQAYNEWLAFAEKRKKVSRTQWGRLGALVFLLLLGPSAVLYWAVVIADIPLFGGSREKLPVVTERRDTGLPPPRPDRRPPEIAAVDPKAQAPAAAPAGEQQQPPAQPALEAKNDVPPNGGSAADNPSTVPTAAERAEPPASAPPAAPRDENAAAPAEVTQALPERAPADEAPGATAQQPPAPQNRGEAPETPSPTPPERAESDPEPAPGSARGAARMLARLKEPDGVTGGMETQQDIQSGAPEYGTRREGLPPGTFTDCDDCPIISAAGNNEALGGVGRAAVSLTEITVADWDGCVADGACPAYDKPLSGSRRETVVAVSQREAEAYARWLSRTTGRPYRHVMSSPKREMPQGCGGQRRTSSGWEWLDDSSGRNCPPEAVADNERGFKVFRRVRPGG